MRLFQSVSRGSILLEALLAGLLLASFLAVVPRYDVRIDRAIVYKQASDVSSVVMLLEIEDQPSACGLVLARANPSLGMKVISGHGEYIVSWGDYENELVIRRPRFKDGRFEEVEFIFGY